MPTVFTQDTSTATTTSYAYNTGYNNIPINSNVLFNVLTQYDKITDRVTALSTKQDTLTIGTNLLGFGQNITSLNYNNITLNKPTNFQADWTTTVINKPTNFQADWTTTVINKPTNFQADWATTVINKPDLTPYVSSNYLNSSLLIYDKITDRQTAITALSSTYVSSNVLTNYLTIYDKITDRQTAITGLSSTYVSSNVLNNYLLPYTNTTGMNTAISTALGSYTNTTGMNTAISTALGSYTNTTGMNTAISTALGSYTNTTGMNTAISTALGSYTNTTGMNTAISTALGSYTNTTGMNTAISTALGSYTNTTDVNTAISTALGSYTNTTGMNTAISTASTNTSNYVSTKFLPLIGGTMTGDLTVTTITGAKVNCSDATGVNVACLGRNLNVVGVNAVMRIWRNDGANSPSIDFMSGPTTSGTSYTWFWDMYIGATTNFFAIRDRRTGGGTPVRFIIDTNGNTGIGTTTNASYRLNVEGSLNATTIYRNGVEIDARYLQLSGGTLTGTLNGTSIITSGNIGIGNPTPIGSLSIGRPDVASDGTLTISKNGSGNRNFKFGYDANFNFCMGDFGGGTSGNTWASTQFSINYSNGNVGIGAVNQSQKLYVNGTATINGAMAVNGILTIQHSSTSFNAAGGGLYVYNPNNTANSSSVLGARIAGSTANKVGISLDVSGVGGWSIYMNGNDTSERWLRFNSSWDGTSSERLQIRGSDGYTSINGPTSISGLLTTNNGLTVNGTSSLQGNATIVGSLSGAANVSRRAIFQFTPSQVLVSGYGLRYAYTINLNNYMNALDVGWGVQYTFLIHIWTNSADYGDVSSSVENMTFHVSLSGYAGGKIRIHQLINNSNGSTIGYNSYNSIYYNGWNGTGGATTKVCVIENISSN